MQEKFSVKKINDKVEIEDMVVNGDPCKAYYEENGRRGQHDCEHDCGLFGSSPEASTKY